MTESTSQHRVRADRAALLLDGAGYYGALRSSLLKAERSIYLVGWDVDSRTPIRGSEPPDDGGPETLIDLLIWLLERNKELVVHILLWDYSILYSFEREPLPRLNLDWRTPRRIKVWLDSRLPFGASRHEKLAIVDERVAYCGGLDLTIRRWDRAEHRAEDPDRKDPGGEPYGPYHDLQIAVDGEAAGALAGIVRSRWGKLAGTELRPVETATDPWPDGVEPDLRAIGVGIARTQAEFEGEPGLREVEAAYLDAIGRAERLIYIENQYLTAQRIAEALCRRLDEQRSLEIVIVNPKSPRGWLEANTMGVGRDRFIKTLADNGNAERVAVLYPWTGSAANEVSIMVHAKLMIVDDHLLQIGSSNLNCRSMGVDNECDLCIEAETDDHRAAIAGLRQGLIAHHLGIAGADFAAAETAAGSTIAAIGNHESPSRGLSRVEATADAGEAGSGLLEELADPERPVDPDEFIGDLFGARRAPALRRHLLKLIGAAAVLSAILIVWRYSPLARWADPETIGGLLAGVAESPWAGPILLSAFVIGSLAAFPVTVLIATTAALLGPVSGFAWAFAGAMLAAAVSFGVGRLIPRPALERWAGTWISSVGKRFERGSIVSMMIVRNLPIAPFTVVNLIAGAAGIRFSDYLVGTALGMAPGIAALTLLGDRLRGVLEDPNWPNFGLLGLAVAVWIGIALGVQSLSNRLADGR